MFPRAGRPSCILFVGWVQLVSKASGRLFSSRGPIGSRFGEHLRICVFTCACAFSPQRSILEVRRQ